MCLQDLWLTQFMVSAKSVIDLPDTAPTVILPPNGQRLNFTLAGGFAYYFRPTPLVAADADHFLYNNTFANPFPTFNREDHGSMVADEWQAYQSSGGAVKLLVIETLLTIPIGEILNLWNKQMGGGKLSWPMPTR